VDIQRERHTRIVGCGPGGVLHDYVAFYFGYLSPMLLQLKTGKVEGYNEGQDPLIYLVSDAQSVRDSGAGFVFADGHGIAAFTSWYDDLADLDKVDWDTVNKRYWADTVEDMDRQRRKQAEFLIHGFLDWSLVHEVVVFSKEIQRKVESIIQRFPRLRRSVRIQRAWYY